MLRGWPRVLLCFAAGAVTSLAQAPFHAFIVCFVTFPILVFVLDGITADPDKRLSTVRQAFATGWLFGWGYFIAGLWWLSNALLVEAPEFAWFIPVAVFGLPAVLAVFYGLATAFARVFWPDSMGRLFSLALFFGLAEWLRSFVLTGFPWNAIGYAAMPVPVLMQSVVLFGLFGMSALGVLLFSLPAAAIAGRRSRVIGALLVILLGGSHVGFGLYRLAMAPDPAADAETRSISVRLVQPNLDQSQKVAREDPAATFDDLLALSALPPEDGSIGQPSWVIWPETAVPYILTRQPAALAAIGDTLADGQVLLTGAVREELTSSDTRQGSRFYNSVLAVSDAGIITGAADKVRLVPFGEFLPLSDVFRQLGLDAIAAADRGYSSAATRSVLTLDDINIVPLVCYEAIFPAQLVPGDIILNVTNDGWFGNTPGPYQHMHQSRLRAVEAGIPLIRLANTGLSGVFDPYGRAEAWISFGERGAADVEVPLAKAQMVAVLDANFNYWLLNVILSIITLTSVILWRRRR